MKIENPDVPFGGITPGSTNFPIGLVNQSADITIDTGLYDEIVAMTLLTEFPKEPDTGGTYLVQTVMHFVGGSADAYVNWYARRFGVNQDAHFASGTVHVPAGTDVQVTQTLLAVVVSDPDCDLGIWMTASVAGVVTQGQANGTTPFTSMHAIKIGGLANQA